MNIGAHVRGGGSLIPSLEAGAALGATSIQVFVQSPRMWKPTQYAPEVLEAYREAQRAHPTITHTFCHATYLINLASDDPDLLERSRAALAHNLRVGRLMGAAGVVVHLGSHKGAGFETAVAQVAEAVQDALDAAESVPGACPLLMENAAGAGGTVGRSLDELEAVLEATGRDERIGLCLDTQHLFASGVDYATVARARALIREVDRRFGRPRLACLHLNDSKTPFGSNRDRHANLGEGEITADGLAPLLGHPAVRDLPLLLEVPGDGDGPRAVDVEAARAIHAAGQLLYQRPARRHPPHQGEHHD
ncbi:MAG: deoxyribonuclease IV [Acidimicrobiales bacterium]